MKKLIGLITAFVIAVTSVTTCFATADVIKINGVDAEIPAGMGIIREKDSRTFVPLRFVSEFLEYEVWYIDNSKTAGIFANDTLLLVQDGNTNLYSSNTNTGETKEIIMDTTAYIEASEGRMYLPIRFLAEATGYTVGWDEATQTVTLDKIQE